MNEEKEILRGKLAGGLFNKKPIILTDKRLKIGENKEIMLSDILEAYTKTESGFGGTWSDLAIRLKNGEEVTCRVFGEKSGGWEMFFQTDTENITNMQIVNKSTQDRWVNLINRLLTDRPLSSV